MDIEDDNLDDTLDEDNFDDITYLPNRHFFLKGAGMLLAVTALLGLAWELSEIPKNWWELTYAGARQASDIRPRSPLALRESSQFDPSKVIGTSGTAPTETSSDREAIQEENRDVEAFTRNRSADDLIGQRVAVHVPIERDNSMVTYWVGSADNPLLVVLHRDVRDGHARMSSEPPAHGIAPFTVGDVATISGTIQRVPSLEGQFSWDLTAAQRSQVQARGIYLLADSVRMNDAAQ